MTDDEQHDRANLLRLYGRDPSDQEESRAASLLGRGSPLTVVLHPWFSLPALFWLTLTSAGLLATAEPMDVPLAGAMGPSVVLSLGAGLLVAAESKRRRLRAGTRSSSGVLS